MPADAPDNYKVRGANMGPIWGQQDPGGPHVGPMNFAIWGPLCIDKSSAASILFVWNGDAFVLLTSEYPKNLWCFIVEKLYKMQKVCSIATVWIHDST